MAYRRGEKSVEIELSKLQSWAETTSDSLDGEYGKPGVIELVQSREVREAEHKVIRERSDRRMTLILSGLAAIPVFLKIAEHFHWF